MNSEIKQAFGHPEIRSAATSSDPKLDRLSLRDHIIEVEIGAFQSERGITQRISFNIVVEVLPSKGAHTDNVDDILSYDSVTEAIAIEIAAERLNLLETLAERVAARILLEPQAERVFVRIEKLDRGAGALGVEIVRSQEETTAAKEINYQVAPLIIHFPMGAIGSEFLTGWIDQIIALDRPSILTVACSSVGTTVGDQIAQRRIELLAMEQTAW
ncbi:MAG: dihydroneopterin aldolase, partial [Paracoccaceae bacterium]|nr:dihydroneopterin aldolase [Paracoccaceae bacterium]